MPEAVTLTPPELYFAANMGVLRQCTNLRDGRVDAHGLPLRDEKGWFYSILGCCGELAVAKALGIYWSGNLGDLKADDVGELQVRTSTKKLARLIIRDTDRSDRVFVLVCGLPPELIIHGWVKAGDAKRMEEFRTDPGEREPAFFIPRDALRPIAELRRGPNEEEHDDHPWA